MISARSGGYAFIVDDHELTNAHPFVLPPFRQADPVTWIERALMRELARRCVSLRTLAHAFGRNASTIIAHTRGLAAAALKARRELHPRDINVYAEKRRARLKAEGVCINGRNHGKATHGCRCERCHFVWKYGLSRYERGDYPEAAR